MFQPAQFAQAGTQPELPTVDGSGLALETPVEVAPELASASGQVEIVVRLVDEPLAVAVGESAKQKGAKLTPASSAPTRAGWTRSSLT